LVRLVDDILKEDLNRDGYINYEEFQRAIQGNSNPQG
jgi:Ca2+-binding EF-hand superfamily protein